MKNKIAELEKVLKNVEGIYPGYIEGIVFDCDHFKSKNSRIAEELLDFIHRNPNADSGEILEHEWILIGLPYCNDDGIWRRWDKVITEEEAQRIAQSEYCED